MPGKCRVPRHRKSTLSTRPEFWRRTAQAVILFGACFTDHLGAGVSPQVHFTLSVALLL